MNKSETALIESLIGDLMRERNLTLSVAESCTGGLVMHRLTNISGSSAYLMGGFVTYSNDAKMEFAGVQPETLETYGAVSEQTAAEMANGVRGAFNTDLALSVTGIAGPTGGTETKPVGLTYIALSSSEGVEVERHVWHGNRERNKAQSAEAALHLLFAFLTR
jgi:nicotinamide-nucleotide amidase